jgi:hypothetical protein
MTMHRFTRLVVATGCLALAAASVRGANLPESTGPALAIANASQDAGEFKAGDKIQAVFALRNEGNDDLKITDARPSCGCTVATFDREIRPGKSGQVHATIETRGMSGPIVKTVTVISNDPAHPQSVLTIHAVVKP